MKCDLKHKQLAAGAHLQQVVLHYVADDAKLVKVATAPLGAKWLLQFHQMAVNVSP